MVSWGTSVVNVQNVLGISCIPHQRGQIFNRRRTSGKRDNVEFKGRSPTDKSPLRPALPSVKTDAFGADTDGLYVTGLVNGRPVMFLVDTGANITILKAQTWEAICHSSEPPSGQLETVHDTMKLADGRSSSFLDRGTMTLRLGDRELDYTLWVAEIEEEEILGLDLLRQYDCQPVLQDGRYELQFGKVSEAKQDTPLTPSCLKTLEPLFTAQQSSPLGARLW